MKICLFGGTFDPPHIGHLLIAQTVCEAENFDKILFIPAYQPPHKTEITPIKNRLE
ncbi:MAG: adenylyltransferase/cytidyltransferase family protein, partial [Candidatus Marinimicrobia bacterium]|nr:adenylyltransferase/cytidyltransferase family protein [Candidatus Neomarinimicrobiota bacterium]